MLKPIKIDCTTDAGNKDRPNAIALIQATAMGRWQRHQGFTLEREVNEDGSYRFVIESTGTAVEGAERVESPAVKEEPSGELHDLDSLKALLIEDVMTGKAKTSLIDGTVTTIGEMLDHPDLTKIDGIGPERAKDVVDIARKLASPEAIAAHPKLQIDGESAD